MIGARPERLNGKIMTSLTICSGLAALLYLAAGMAIVGAMKQKAGKASSLIRWPVLLGLMLHGYAIKGEMFQQGAVHFGFAFALSVTFFFAVIALFIESLIHRLHGLFGIILIAAAFGTLLPVIFPGAPIPAQEWTGLFRWHLLLALGAYSFMTIALVQAVLMSLQNRQLKKGAAQESHFLDSLPGLVVMERIFFRIVVVGFICLTLVLLTGSLATYEALGTYLQLDHKMLLTWMAWVIIGLLLIGRRFAGWRAKTALNWFWAGFGVLVVAYVGYSFIREIF